MSTRYPGGIYIGFEPPGYLPVLECLYHTILPKGDVQSRYGTRHDWLSHGLPDNIHTDYAKEFVSPSLQDFCDSHNIHLRQIPGKRPHLRPFIERYFRTKNSGLFHTLPGTTFANYGKRGDYNSLKEACLTLQELEAILHKFLLDLYAEGYHRGLKGIPARRWEALSAQYPPRLPQSAEDLLIGLGRVTHRVVDKDGIDFETIRYNCDELAVLRHHLPKGQKVKIKFHPGDLSRIYLIHPFGEGALEVPALDQAYTQGLSLWQHNIIRRCERAARREVNPAERGRVRREIQTVVKAGKARSRQLRTRRAAARFEAVPPSLRDRYPEPDPSAPPALPVGQGAEDAVLDDATLQALQAEADEGWGLILPGSADVPGLFEQEETRHED